MSVHWVVTFISLLFPCPSRLGACWQMVATLWWQVEWQSSLASHCGGISGSCCLNGLFVGLLACAIMAFYLFCFFVSCLLEVVCEFSFVIGMSVAYLFCELQVMKEQSL
jgi:hypothetical protein